MTAVPRLRVVAAVLAFAAANVAASVLVGRLYHLERADPSGRPVLASTFFTGAARQSALVPTAAALRSFGPADQFVDGMFARVSADSLTYEWNSSSEDPDDGVGVIEPDAVVGTGRWLLVPIKTGFAVAAANVTQTVGGDSLSAPDIGAFVSVTTTTGNRGFVGYQINGGPQGARVTLKKARGTTASPTVPSNADGVGRYEVRAWDGTQWAQAGYLDFEVRNQFGTISGSLPAVRAALNTFGPSYAANELGSGALQVPLGDTYHDISRNITNATPVVALTTQTINSNTMTLYRALVLGRDQVTGDLYQRDAVVRVERTGAGAAVIRAATSGSDPNGIYATDGTWSTSFAVASNQLQVSITSDATNSVHWSTYVWETTIPYP